MVDTLQEATTQTSILLIHAPYPGTLKFEGMPGSLLSAVALALPALADADEQVGYLDPRGASEEFYAELRSLARGGSLRVVCVSTSTAAIEEAARVVATIREEAGDRVLLLAGGPHEDDCPQKMAGSISGIDLSIAGDAEHALGWLLPQYVEHGSPPQRFCESLPASLAKRPPPAGRVRLTSPWWPLSTPHLDLDGGPLSFGEIPDRPVTDQHIEFTAFASGSTLPVMISRGCPYGRCIFCSEASPDGRVLVQQRFDWLEELCASRPGHSVYFQDSIFPTTTHVRTTLLPMLSRLGVEWGCQVYLPMLSERTVQLLAHHGCRYVYTGVESGAAAILSSVGKPALTRNLLLERLKWLRRAELRVGLSLMFGALSTEGALLETAETVRETVGLCEEVLEQGTTVAGFYPNVETVLPGTPLATGLDRAGIPLDFYRMPRCPDLDGLEDGGVGYNFLTIDGVHCQEPLRHVAGAIASAATYIQSLVEHDW